MARIGLLKKFTRLVRRGAQVNDVEFDPGGKALITGEGFAAAGDDSHPLVESDYILADDLPKSGNEAVMGYVDPINPGKAEPGDKRIYSRRTSDGLYIAEGWLKNDGTIIHNSYKFNGNTRILVSARTMNSVTGVVTDEVFADDGALRSRNIMNNIGTITSVSFASDGSTQMSRHIQDAIGTHLIDNDAGGSITMLVNGTVDINGTTFALDEKVVIPESLTLNGNEIDGHQHDVLSGSSASPPSTSGNL